MVAPSRPTERSIGWGTVRAEKSVLVLELWWLALILRRMKHDSPMKHRNPGIPTPKAMPYLAAPERPGKGKVTGYDK